MSKYCGNENIDANACNTYYGRSKANGKCGMYQIFWVA
jgi:hypothetical protein